MPRFAANLSMMFTEWAFLDRFGAAADAGFEAVEFLYPYAHPPDAIAERLERHRLRPALFNLPPGDVEAGERGLAALPERFDELKRGVETARRYAAAAGVKRMHLMAGLARRDDPCAGDAYRRAVSHAAEVLGADGIEVMIEPINGRDMPGYFLDDFAFASALIDELALPNLKLQFDLYHRQIMHGDVTTALRSLMPKIGHIQIAGVPDRHEPTGCELDFRFLFGEIDLLGYQGFVGCEYRPRAGTLAGLGWLPDAIGQGSKVASCM